MLGRYFWRSSPTAQGASMPLTPAGTKQRSGGSSIHRDWSRTREIPSEMTGFSIQHSGGEPERTARAKAAQSHPQAIYKPTAWEERATHKPPPCDPHATLMRPSCDPHATYKLPSSHPEVITDGQLPIPKGMGSPAGCPQPATCNAFATAPGQGLMPTVTSIESNARICWTRPAAALA